MFGDWKYNSVKTSLDLVKLFYSHGVFPGRHTSRNKYCVEDIKKISSIPERNVT